YHGIYNLFQMPAGDGWKRVPERDHFSLLGKPDPSVVADGRQSQNRLVGAPAATAHGASPPVEQPEIDFVFMANPAQFLLSFLKRPVGHPVTAVFVTIGIAQHDFLEL